METDEDRPSTAEPREIPLASIVPDDDAIELTDLDEVPDEVSEAIQQSEGMFRRPSFWPSVAWTLLLMGSQAAIGTFMVVVTMLRLLAKGRPDPSKLQSQVEQAMEGWMLPVASFSTMLFSFAVVCLVLQNQTIRCMAFRGLTVTQIVLTVLIATPMAVLCSELANCVSHLYSDMSMLKMFGSFAQQPWALVFMAGCVFPGIGEELFFRGFLSRGLVSRHGVVWGTLFAAFLFGAVHIHPVQASGAFLLGITLQLVFLATKSLWGAILLHTTNNSLAFAAMIYGNALPIEGFTESSESAITHSPILLTGAAVMAVATLLYALHETRTQWVRPDGTIWSRNFVTAEGPIEPGVEARWQPISVRTVLLVFGSCIVFVGAVVLSVAQ